MHGREKGSLMADTVPDLGSLRALPTLRAEAFRNLDVASRLDSAGALEREIAKSRVLENLLGEVRQSVGFNPDVAISVVFGLKW